MAAREVIHFHSKAQLSLRLITRLFFPHEPVAERPP